jgi:hypothetical protein
MSTLWARVVITEDQRAFALEVSDETYHKVIDDLRPTSWRKTSAGIYRVEFGWSYRITQMTRLCGIPGADEPVGSSGGGSLIADDFQAISEAMRNLGLDRGSP